MCLSKTVENNFLDLPDPRSNNTFAKGLSPGIILGSAIVASFIFCHVIPLPVKSYNLLCFPARFLSPPFVGSSGVYLVDTISPC